MEENWKAVPGFEESYEVSDLGRVRSLMRMVKQNRGGKRPVQGQIIKQNICYSGYLGVKLRREGKTYQFLVSRLVLIAFVGDPECDGMYACHGNNNHTDNRLANLRWDTAKGNCFDKLVHGTNIQGEKSYLSNLNESQVIKIRDSLKNGRLGSALAKEYGVTDRTISLIKLRRTWKHV